MHDSWIEVGYLYSFALMLAAVVHEWDPYAGLWVGVVSVSAAFAWENLQP